ncbi:hydroxyethylthiazole kinase [Olea europaea var. sylvestris]|uniref:Hydroxyethylthiazole kinase n=1 Tax=Olea europaea subsp. europaea TaxID=158383 RepID=A0A8S0PCM1_OLEEU|nr:hydroxyethylthiazole kinase [Olea europaea var. sylvestris]XP_022858597.1 hydroxyethylthiazole kinase [Olea europaea var. sylvestris]CAA2935686.1 hydroxyethylthiazole kinase [Olea europaea subsp. europaea]
MELMGDKNDLPKQDQQWARQAWAHLSRVRQQSPLIQCITNFVSMDFVANVMLAAGASPAMIHSIEEIPDFTPKAHALYINVGTLTPDWLPAMKLAIQVANENKKPWVLDPVAAGASGFRLKACLELLGMKPAVVRGNGSEIIALFKGSEDSDSKGVDSMHESTDAVEAAKSLAQVSGSIVSVSGAVDIVTDGQRVVGAKNGISMLQKITATGCSVTALIAAFVAIDPSRAFEATASAFSVFGVASEIGMDMAKGPASLRMHMIDSLYGLDQATVLHRVNISAI